MRKLFVSAFLVAASFSGQARAADLAVAPPIAPLPPVAPASTWRYQVSGYGFLSSIGGDVGIRHLPDADVNIPFSKVLSHLKGVFAGNAVARSDMYYFSIDGMWVKLGANVHFRVTQGPFGGVGAELTDELGIVTSYAGVRLPIGSPDFALYAIVGGRYQGLGVKLALTQDVTGFSRTNSQSVGWVDPLVGMAVHYPFNDKWFADGSFDVGGFGVGSKFTNQNQVTIGYNWTQSISSSFGYRTLYTNYVKDNGLDGSFRYNALLYGPYASVSYNF
jgi:hypothetical protein